jgi:hypothetical protein
MSWLNKLPDRTKIVIAPPPTDAQIMPSIYSIEIREDLAVQWLWTDLPDGNRVVTGYKLAREALV